MTDTIFSGEASPTTSTSTPGTQPQNQTTPASGIQDGGSTIPDEVKEFVGPGKKYATVADALKSIPHAQKHISNLELETNQLKTEMQRSREELLSMVETERTSRENTTSVDPNSVAEIVIQKMEQRTAEQVAKDNLALASDTLVEKAGSVDEATKLMVAKASELGMTVKEMQILASKSPKAFLTYFDAVQKPNTTGDTVAVNSRQSSASVVTQVNAGEPAPNTYKWYNKMRKEKGDNWYFSPQVTRERAQMAEKMGKDKFFS